MERVVLALVIVAIAAVLALIVERRRPAPPTQATWAVPAQLVGGSRQELETLCGGLSRDLGEQPGLPDAGFTLHDGGLTGALAGLIKQPA